MPSRVELASAEGEPGSQTLWVDTANRRVVKTSGALANGALVTSELVKSRGREAAIALN
jgi:hypothetical protein